MTTVSKCHQMVHDIRRGTDRLSLLVAVEAVMRTGPVLTIAETDAFLAGLSVQRSELTIQWHPSLER